MVMEEVLRPVRNVSCFSSRYLKNKKYILVVLNESFSNNWDGRTALMWWTVPPISCKTSPDSSLCGSPDKTFGSWFPFLKYFEAGGQIFRPATVEWKDASRKFQR